MEEAEARTIILKYTDTISQAVPDARWMPLVHDEVYGCGDFGCVFRTRTDGVVFKITTDELEIKMVKQILRENLNLPGFVQYLSVVHLYGKAYALWREEVTEMGEFGGYRESLQIMRKINPCAIVLKSSTIQEVNSEIEWAIDTITPSRYADEFYGTSKYAAAAFRLYDLHVLSLQHMEESKEIGDSLRILFNLRIFLQDIRYDNLGLVNRDREILVIADPSIPVFLI